MAEKNEISVTTNNLTAYSNRLLIYIRYYDDKGLCTKNVASAYRQDVIVRYDLYIKSLTEDYSDTAEYGSGTKSETSVFQYTDDEDEVSQIIKVYPEEYNTLTQILTDNITKTCKVYSFKIQNPSSDISIGVDFVQTLLSSISRIYLDFTYLQQWITFPAFDSTNSVVSVSNANLKFNNSVINVESLFELANCTLAPTDSGSAGHLTINSDLKISLSNITLSGIVYVRASCATASDAAAWKNTLIEVSSYTYTFEDITSPPDSNSYGALLRCSGAYTHRVSSVVSRYDIPYYTLLALSGGYQFDVSTITRASTNKPAMVESISLSTFFVLNMSTITYIGISASKSTVKFVTFPKTRLEALISISDINLANMSLASYTGVKCTKLNISNASITTDGSFGNCDLNGISSMSLLDVVFEGDEFDVLATKVQFTRCDIKAKTLIKIKATELFNSISTNLTSETDIEFVVSSIAKFNVTDSILKYVSDFIITADDTPDSYVTTRPSIQFNSAQITGASFTLDGVERVTISSSGFNSVRSLAIKNATYCSFDADIKYNTSAVDAVFENVVFNKSQYRIARPNLTPKLSFKSCSGKFDIVFYQDSINVGNTTALTLADTILSSKITADEKRVITINSEGSAGSAIVSGSTNVAIAPVMSCADLSKFKLATALTDRSDSYLYYGTIS